MKKAIIAFILVLVTIVSVGCKKPPEKKEIKATDFLPYLTATINQYKTASSGNILIEMDAEEETSLEYIYNYSGTSLEGLLCVLERGDIQLGAYVKDDISYINVNNEKTKTALTLDEETNIKNNYGFEAMTADIFAVFDKSLFAAFSITGNADGVVVLTWDPTKYVLLSDGLSDDEFLEASERFDDISENIKALVVTITYANELVTKIESTWTKQDDSLGTIGISFRGTSLQTIDYPADLSTYHEQD